MDRLRICSINARTLSSSSYQLEIEEALDKIRWDLCVVSEARIVGSGTFVLVKSQSVIFHSGGTTAHRGVCFIVTPFLSRYAVFKPINDRLATLRLPQNESSSSLRTPPRVQQVTRNTMSFWKRLRERPISARGIICPFCVEILMEEWLEGQGMNRLLGLIALGHRPPEERHSRRCVPG